MFRVKKRMSIVSKFRAEDLRTWLLFNSHMHYLFILSQTRLSWSAKFHASSQLQ